mmetsp:Transcript_22619/g.52209  ORF Transcript_22619/g.52209 Transcript_22619/m.52209 type:complete len:164 (-) Transcript_22619:565-1056(-)
MPMTTMTTNMMDLRAGLKTNLTKRTMAMGILVMAMGIPVMGIPIAAEKKAVRVKSEGDRHPNKMWMMVPGHRPGDSVKPAYCVIQSLDTLELPICFLSGDRGATDNHIQREALHSTKLSPASLPVCGCTEQVSHERSAGDICRQSELPNMGSNTVLGDDIVTS